MLSRDYTNVSVLSIAANGRDMSFSSDTGMAECLVIARKLKLDERPPGRVWFGIPAAQAPRFCQRKLTGNEDY